MKHISSICIITSVLFSMSLPVQADDTITKEQKKAMNNQARVDQFDSQTCRSESAKRKDRLFRFGPPSPSNITVSEIARCTDVPGDVYSDNPEDVKMARAIVAVRYEQISNECAQYFGRLINRQNEIDFQNDTVTAGAATTGAIMALTKATTKATGVVAATFGFSSSTLKNYRNRALMTPYPSETQNLILSAQHKYKMLYPPEGVPNLAVGLAYVNGFQDICSYAGITRFAKQALTDGADTPSVIVGDTAAVNVVKAKVEALLSAKTLSSDDLSLLYLFIVTPPESDVGQKAVSANLSKASFAKKVQADDGKPKTDAITSQVGALVDVAYKLSTDFKSSTDAYKKKLETPATGQKPSETETPTTKSSNVPNTATLKTLGM